MAAIHPTAIIAEGARLGDGVEIGPYCVIGPHVRIGGGTRMMAHVFADGHTTFGERCTVFPFASVGTQTQDLKFKGGTPRVEIGNGTTIREYVTVNAATFDGGVTRVGDNCHIMAYAHIAHDCIVGNHVIIANAGTLAGHVTVEDRVIIGGLVGVHQFVRLGHLSIIGGCSKVTMDVPPFMTADGNPLKIHGVNSIGMKRAGLSEASQAGIKDAYRILYRRDLTTAKALEAMRAEVAPSPELDRFAAFVASSERGITR